MSAADRVYRLLLRAYPAAFRAAYGREMALVFRDRRRAPGARGIRFWTEMVWDVARSAPPLRLEAWRARWGVAIQTKGGTMKTMAILAVVIGALEALNALAETWAGGVAGRNASALLGLALAVVAGAMLLASGIALLRRSRGAAALARGAALACLAVFALIALATPMLSVLATVLGIGFPIALLIFLRWTRRRGPSMPTAA